MKSIFILCMLMVLTSCGYSSKDNEVIGQVKKVQNENPILCDEWISVDISLGVMRGGVGSMSTQDLWLYVANAEQSKLLRDSATNGNLVKITFSDKRFTWCVYKRMITKIEVIK